MNLNIKATKLELTPALQEYIKKKISSLDKFLKRFEKEGEVKVEAEVSRTTKHHRKGEVFYAEVNIYLPKKLLRIAKYETDIRKAINKVKDHLKEEIQKYKETL